MEIPVSTVRTISTNLVTLFKHRASRMESELNITHAEALDLRAQQAGFCDWAELIQANDRIKPAETAASQGVVIAFDTKDGMEVDTGDDILIQDPLLEETCKEMAFIEFANELLDEVPNLDKDTLEAEFQAEYDLMFFRVHEDSVGNDISAEEIGLLVTARSFFPPRYIWQQGKCVYR